jgi:hypothetical protein
MKRVVLLFALLTGLACITPASADKYETSNLKGTILCPPADTMIAFSARAQALFGDIAQGVSNELVKQLTLAGTMNSAAACSKPAVKKVYLSFDIDATETSSASALRAYSIFAYVTDPRPSGYPGYVILWSRSSVKATVADPKKAVLTMADEVFGYVDEFDIDHKTANP